MNARVDGDAGEGVGVGVSVGGVRDAEAGAAQGVIVQLQGYEHLEEEAEEECSQGSQGERRAGRTRRQPQPLQPPPLH